MPCSTTAASSHTRTVYLTLRPQPSAPASNLAMSSGCASGEAQVALAMPCSEQVVPLPATHMVPKLGARWRSPHTL